MRGENLEATEKRAWDMWSHLTTLGRDPGPGIDPAVADFNADSLLNTTRLTLTGASMSVLLRPDSQV